MPKIGRILVPVDFSECSRAALDYATLLAERMGSTIDVLHVWEPPRFVGPEFLIRDPGEKGHPLLEAERVQVESEMAEFLSLAGQQGKVGVRIESGKPFQTITRIAGAEDYDLIVMGTHGRSGLPHLLIGSVAERVVRTADCPVVTIREPGGKHAEAGTESTP